VFSTISQTSPWVLTTKPTFQAEVLAAKEDHLLEEKIHLLAYDPYPDGRVKKILPGSSKELYMLRAGDYAVFYTIQRPFVRLLALRPRQAFTSSDGFPSQDEIAQLLGNPFAPFHWEQVHSFQVPTRSEEQPLPRRLTPDFLRSLRISVQYHSILLRVRTRQELLNCPGVPPEGLQRLDVSLFEQPLARTFHEPDYVLPQVSDLRRYKDGSLHTFLLLLAPEQERAVTWASKASGPVQVKGKPGTGKSTVALYRIRSFIQKQQEAGQSTPRILFTTYTNALVETSKQLLEQLLETQMNCVEVVTADALIRQLFGERPHVASSGTQSELLRRALQQIFPEEVRRQMFLSKHSEEYLLEEINQVIIARKILTETSYLSLERKGRKVPANEALRKTIWHLYNLFCTSLHQHRQETWSQWRVRAEEFLLQQGRTPCYDAVFIDEAQDLEPSVLRILLMVCKTSNSFFITADANQSIYNKGFTWVSIHEELRFQGGRTIALKTNYRSTRQIGEAAESYLRTGTGEIEKDEWSHAHNGSPPAMRKTADVVEEAQILRAFLNEATQSLHLGLQNCAILCPTKQGGKLLVQALNKQGIEATFQTGRDIDLSAPGIKVLTLHASKGLEFPVVALAGFHQSQYTQPWENLSEEEREEKLAQARRVLFVGMTRAMKTLLVLVPAETRSTLFTGFDPAYWNVESKECEKEDRDA
jgi:superfamily I DNA/RNA helicase/mRNA-degrading endonuclease RelE of RelBE toxin-antitoxin system